MWLPTQNLIQFRERKLGIKQFVLYILGLPCYNTHENRISGSLQVSVCNARVKRERSVNLRQDRYCEVELQANATGESREGACGVEAESGDLPDK